VKRPRAHAAPAATAPHQVRIIGGRWRRTPIAVLDVQGLRPTPDRVRETVFNWLAHLRPGFESLRGLDLFAGTGAMGFELASRGAQRVVLVERDRGLADRLEALRQRLDAAGVEIVRGDAMLRAAAMPEGGFDLVFVDPPYDSGLLAPALRQAARLLVAGGLVYAENATPIPEDLLRQAGLTYLRAARAGRVHYYLLQRDPGTFPGGGPATADEPETRS